MKSDRCLAPTPPLPGPPDTVSPQGARVRGAWGVVSTVGYCTDISLHDLPSRRDPSYQHSLPPPNMTPPTSITSPSSGDGAHEQHDPHHKGSVPAGVAASDE